MARLTDVAPSTSFHRRKDARMLGTINDVIWIPMAFFALLVGLYFTVLTRAGQFRLLPDMVRQIFAKPLHAEGIAPVQALLLTLASRVGVGNIAGVGTAIAAGGPGAMFWMVVVALLGSASAFAETVLAQVYKRRISGEDRGGAPFYIQFGLGMRWLAVIFAILYMVIYGFLTSGVQANNIASAADNALSVPTWATAIVLTALMAFTIIGGTQRIIRAAQLMVPVMALGYIVFAFALILLNLDQVLPTIGMVIASAFGRDQVFGGIAGAAIAWGVRRAVFSNVAGVGEGTFGSAAASVSHPAKQGLVQSFSIFIDTCVVCLATGIMIIITGSYNVIVGERVLVEHLPGVDAGAAFTQSAVNTAVPGFGPAFVAVALFFFAFTSMVAYYYIAETNLVFIRGRAGGWPTWVLKIGAIAITAFGSVASADAMWSAGDIGYGILGWFNMLAILALSPRVLTVARDYDAQRRAGLDPVFEPEKLGIQHATWWANIREQIDHGAAPRETHEPAASTSQDD